MIPQVLVPLAHGFEEIEATCPIDLLRRADVEVITASCEDELLVIGRSGIAIQSDSLLKDISPKSFELLVLPGGPSVFKLRERSEILELIKFFYTAQKPIGAICAAPLLLKDAGLLNNLSYTAHGSVSNELMEMKNDQAVVKDGHIITSRGAGTAVEFGLSLVELLRGREKADEIRQSIHA